MQLGRKIELTIILTGAAAWLPGIMDLYFLSDDFYHIETWGLPPLAQTFRWFYTEYVGFYRPLTALLWKLHYSLWEMEPAGYQLGNLLIHTGCALLIWDIARRLLPNQDHIGLWAALLFLFMPGHVFGVLLIAALTGLLCSFFYLASIACYLRGRTGRRLHELASLLFFFLALLTKELAVSLPLLVLLWEIVFQLRNGYSAFRSIVRICLPYWFVFSAYLALRFFLFGQLTHSPLLHTNVDPINLLINAARYVAAISAPWGIESLKPFFRTHHILLLPAAGALCALLLFGSWRARRQLRPEHAFFPIWIAVTMLPVLRIYSPWNTYLPSAGSAILIPILVSRFFRAYKNPARKEAIAVGALVLLFALYSILHQIHWQEAGDLCKRVLDAAERAAEDREGRLYLANLPTEMGEAPVFGGGWGLTSGMTLRGCGGRIEPLIWERKVGPLEDISTVVTGAQVFELALKNPDEFFRLESPEFLTRRLRPEIGYTYTKAEAQITVKGLSLRGEPNHIEIDIGAPWRLQQVLVWDGEDLIPLLDK